jgi:nucleotide-binding universal stress UspA family protein
MGASKSAQYTDIYSITPNMVKPIEEGMFTAAKANLQRLVNKISEDGEIEIVVEVRKGRPHQEILQFQKENDIDFIIMASRGKGGLTNFHLGSTTEKVLRTMPCCITIAKF